MSRDSRRAESISATRPAGRHDCYRSAMAVRAWEVQIRNGTGGCATIASLKNDNSGVFVFNNVPMDHLRCP